MTKLWMELCRLCAREDCNNTHINVFSKNKEPSLSDTIKKCFSINMNQVDDWPKRICTSCHQLITTMIAFSQRALNVQAMFDELVASNGKLTVKQLKIQYHICELDDVKVDPITEPHETNPVGNAGMAEPMVDLAELGYIDSDMPSPAASIKAESSAEYNHAPSSQSYDHSSDDYTPQFDKDFKVQKRKRGRPRKDAVRSSKKQKKTTKFFCADCDKTFLQNLSYRKHMQADHGITVKPPEFPCSKCSKTFSTSRSLKSHEISHLPPEKKLTIPCPYCDRKFSTHSVVQTHVRSMHIGEKPFVCEECGKTYKSFGSLRDHAMMIHSEDSPFECTKCQKRFKTKNRLKIHMDTHNETAYICTICGLQLNTRRTLLMHMVVHSDQKQYKCDYCGNEFKRAKALKNHLILHTGLKPYKCNFCEKSFAAGSSCRAHKKRTHPAELAEMEASGTKFVHNQVPNLEQLRAVANNKAGMIKCKD